jgi:hypothetical protein
LPSDPAGNIKRLTHLTQNKYLPSAPPPPTNFDDGGGMRAKAGQGYLGEAERWFNYMERSFKCGTDFEWSIVRDRDLSVETA